MSHRDDLKEAVRLYALGEDTETAARKAGVSPDELTRAVEPYMDAAVLGKLDPGAILDLCFGECGNCSEPMGRDEKFCSFCGQENPQFDESVFTQMNDMTLAVFKAEECDGFHRLQKDAGFRYCDACGKCLDVE